MDPGTRRASGGSRPAESVTEPRSALPASGADEPTDSPEGEITSQAERSSLLTSALLLRLRPVWPWLVFALVALVGWSEVRRVDLLEVRGILKDTPASLTLMLLLFTGLNLSLAGLYDVTALGPLRRSPRPTSRWGVGIVTFAWSNFLTLGPLAGPALRLWLYRPLGVEGKRARSALSSIVAAFSMGLLGWCAAALVPLPAALDSFFSRMALGVAATAAVGGALSILPRLPLLPGSFRQWEGNPYLLALVASADWLLAWVVFHLALFGIHGGVEMGLSLRSFFLGQVVGLLSLIPGGLGSADAAWILSLGKSAGGHDKLLASLLLYRFVYYLLPWAFATLFLAGRRMRAGRRTKILARLAISSYAFLCGVVLLASAATPSISGRMVILRRLPLAVVEISHWASVLLGFLMLVVSRGLRRGYRSSHRVALSLFLAGALTTFLKGLDFEEAAVALGAAAFLLIFHRFFEHAGRLRPPLEFMVSIGLFAVVLFVAVGFGSFNVPGLEAAFGRFGETAQAERFLRGLILLVAVALGAAFHFAQRAQPRDRLPDPEEIGQALSFTRRLSRTTNPLLAAAGDKALFWLPSEPGGDEGVSCGSGFMAYRTVGRFLIAYSDPVCPAGRERDLLKAFLEEAANQDRDVILYQISPALIPAAHDFGFSFFKLGEEGIVDLSRFDLKGNKAKKWRNALNRVERAGGGFEILEGEALARVLPELREVSDAWLQKKQGAEKGFSIGRFDEAYLSRFPCAVVRDGSGQVAGFANLLEGRPGGELSVDLMRYHPGRTAAEPLGDVIEYLFIRLMLHGKERGFATFNLGMAPLSSVGELRWARFFERLAHLFFRHGEHWFNFQGLRRFKEKFEPEWEPRYLAYPRPWDWPAAVISTALLIAGGWSTLLFARRRPA
jgi:phosphatidylglycerol lysyltransferase